MHGRGGFYVEEFEVSGKERRGHIEDVGRHEEVDEHGLEYLVLEVGGESGEVEDGSHAYVVERVEGVEQLGAGAGQRAEAVEAPEDSLELGYLVAEVSPDVGVEVVGVHGSAVLDAVAEPGVNEFYAEFFHEQQDVLIDGGDAGGDGYVERDG